MYALFSVACPSMPALRLLKSTDVVAIAVDVNADESIAVDVDISRNEHQEPVLPAGRHVWSEDIFKMHK